MVKSYISSCTNCAQTKAPHHKPYGKLKQLPMPDKLWNSISMDFIEHLPSSDGFTAILVVVDHLTKQSLFIPTQDTINSPNLPSYSSLTSSPNMEYHCTSPLIRAPNLCLTSSI